MPPVEAATMIEVSRTLMKSEPELAELVATVEGVEVTMAEKGFGTRVAVRAAEDDRPRARPTSRPSSTAWRSRSDSLSAAASSELASQPRRQQPLESEQSDLKRHLTVANVLVLHGPVHRPQRRRLRGDTLEHRTRSRRTTSPTKRSPTPKLKNAGVTASKIANGAVIASRSPTARWPTEARQRRGHAPAQLGGGVVTSKPKTRHEAKLRSRTGKLGADAVDRQAPSVSGPSSRPRASWSRTSPTSTRNAPPTTPKPEGVTADCPTGKQAIGGGVRIARRRPSNVAVTEHRPVVNGVEQRRTGWIACGRESPGGRQTGRSSAYAVCAEL